MEAKAGWKTLNGRGFDEDASVGAGVGCLADFPGVVVWTRGRRILAQQGDSKIVDLGRPSDSINRSRMPFVVC